MVLQILNKRYSEGSIAVSTTSIGKAKKDDKEKKMGTNKFDNLQRVTFESIRQKIKPTDLFFASGNYTVSRMIRQFSDSLFSHVGFVLTWDARIILFESVEDDGVRAVPLSQYVNNYENTGAAYDGRLFLARFSPTIDDTATTQSLGQGTDLLNRKYNKEEIAEILARMALNVGHYEASDSYICSESVDVCFKAGDIIFPRAIGGFIYPEQIAADPRVIPLWEIIG